MSDYKPNPGDEVLLTVGATVDEDGDYRVMIPVESGARASSMLFDRRSRAIVSVEPVPQFFRALADVDTLDGVIGICQRLGWADTTEREREGGPLSQPLPTGRHAVIWADTPHHGRRLLSRYDGERRDQWVCDDEGLRTSYRSEDLSRVEVAFKGVAS